MSVFLDGVYSKWSFNTEYASTWIDYGFETTCPNWTHVQSNPLMRFQDIITDFMTEKQHKHKHTGPHPEEIFSTITLFYVKLFIDCLRKSF